MLTTKSLLRSVSMRVCVQTDHRRSFYVSSSCYTCDDGMGKRSNIKGNLIFCCSRTAGQPREPVKKCPERQHHKYAWRRRRRSYCSSSFCYFVLCCCLRTAHCDVSEKEPFFALFLLFVQWTKRKAFVALPVLMSKKRVKKKVRENVIICAVNGKSF